MLDGAPAMVAMFDALGDALGTGPWIRYLIGAIDVVSAVAVLVPSLAAYGALVLSVTMIGTLATRLFLSDGPLVPPLVFARWIDRDCLGVSGSAVAAGRVTRGDATMAAERPMR